MKNRRGEVTHGPNHQDGVSHQPHGSIWPAVLAFGITLALFGIVSTFTFGITGLLLIVLSVVGWMGELRHE